MVNINICDDNEKDRKNISEIVNKFAVSNNIEYSIQVFSDYDKKFEEKINEKIPSKIYLLDIETPSASGIDIARKMKEQKIDIEIISTVTGLSIKEIENLK